MTSRFWIFIFLVHSAISYAQNEVDALRYSFNDFAGSARSAGMSGAFSAAGADLSSIHGNPAGLAAYRRGAAEINLAYRDLSSSGEFESQNSIQTSNYLGILNAGIANIFGIPGKENKKIVFGSSYAKTNFFHEKNSLKGIYNGSMLESFRNQANGSTEDELYTNFPFTAWPAYYTYLLDLQDTLNLQYRYNAKPPAQMQHDITRSGSQSELSFAFGYEISESLLLGVGLKMMSLDFTEEYSHGESFGDSSDVTDFNFSYDLQSVGDAYSLSLGAIYIPIPKLRIGLSAETPALLMMDEYFTTETASNYLDETFLYASDELQSSSIIRIPGKIQTQISAILDENTILNIDAERRSYQNSSIEGDAANTYDYATENEVIKTIYKSATKISVGVERRLTQVFHLRAGMSWIESPFKKMQGILSKDIIRLAAGGGYRSETWCVDAAIQLQQNQSQYFMYDPNLVPPGVFKNSLMMLTLGLGYRFRT
jgi:long-subunit fatty acid transport protein